MTQKEKLSSTIKKQEEQYNTQYTGNEIHNSQFGEQLLINEPIPNTPFRIVGNNKQGYAITIGLHRLTIPKLTKEEALEVLYLVDWNLIANMIVAITRTYDEIEHGLKGDGKGPLTGNYKIDIDKIS